MLYVSVHYRRFGPLRSILLVHYRIGPLLTTHFQVLIFTPCYSFTFSSFSYQEANTSLWLPSSAPQTVSGGPPSYICRLTGQSNENWSFWLEVMI